MGAGSLAMHPGSATGWAFVVGVFLGAGGVSEKTHAQWEFLDFRSSPDGVRWRVGESNGAAYLSHAGVRAETVETESTRDPVAPRPTTALDDASVAELPWMPGDGPEPGPGTRPTGQTEGSPAPTRFQIDLEGKPAPHATARSDSADDGWRIALESWDVAMLRKAAQARGGDVRVDVVCQGVAPEDLILMLEQDGYFSVETLAESRTIAVGSGSEMDAVRELAAEVERLETRRRRMLYDLAILRERQRAARGTEIINSRAEPETGDAGGDSVRNEETPP